MVTVLGMTVLLLRARVRAHRRDEGRGVAQPHAVKRDAAYQAAEAGVDDYIAKLIDDRLYYVHFVHPGEATRQGDGERPHRRVEQTWQQSDGNAWTYPSGKDRWFGSAKLGNGYEYDLEIVPPSASQPLIQILSTAPAGERHRHARLARARGAGAPVVRLRLPDVRRRQHHATAPARRPTGRSMPASTANGVAHSVNARRHRVRRHLCGGERHGRHDDDERRAEVQLDEHPHGHQVADQLQQLPRVARRHPQRRGRRRDRRGRPDGRRVEDDVPVERAGVRPVVHEASGKPIGDAQPTCGAARRSTSRTTARSTRASR